MDNYLLVSEVEKGILLISLNRPEKRNALNIPLLNQFCQVMEKIQKDLSIRVVIFNGTGPVFCSGLDLKEISMSHDEEESAALLTRTLKLVYESPFVTMAAVHGAAIAGGAGLMAACDIVVASSDLQCGFPEVRRGLVAAQITAILHRQITWRNLREMLFLGEVFDAEKGMFFGLINRIVPPEQLMQATLQLAYEVLRGAPNAVRESKHLLANLTHCDLDEDLKISTPFHHRARHSKEAAEGARAFLEKREPVWK